MKIIVFFTWYRDLYNQESVTRSVILESPKKSKRAVTQTIRDWVSDWTGRGYVEVSSVDTTFEDDKQYCDIAQKKFNFNNV